MKTFLCSNRWKNRTIEANGQNTAVCIFASCTLGAIKQTQCYVGLTGGRYDTPDGEVRIREVFQ